MSNQGFAMEVLALFADSDLAPVSMVEHSRVGTGGSLTTYRGEILIHTTERTCCELRWLSEDLPLA